MQINCIDDLHLLILNPPAPTTLPDEELLDFAEHVTLGDGEPLPVDVHMELAARGYDAGAYTPGDELPDT